MASVGAAISSFRKSFKERVAMEGILKQANESLKLFIDPKYVKDTELIPKFVLQQCKGIAFITVVKAGFLLSGETGTGCVMGRVGEEFSGPVAIGTGGVSVGFLAGASKVDMILVLNTNQALKAFAGDAQVRLGSELSVVAGPVGRQAEASLGVGKGAIDAVKKLDMAPAFAYSHAKGLYGGIALNGKIIVKRTETTAAFYGKKVDAAEVLEGKIAPPDNDIFRQLQSSLLRFTQTKQEEKEGPKAEDQKESKIVQ